MPKQKRRIFFFILLIILMLGVLSHFYVNQFLLPEKIKTLFEDKAKNYFKRNVTISDVSFTLFQGFTLKDITVFRDDEPSSAFIKIKKADFNVLILPFLKSKQIIVPSISVKQPYVFISRMADGRFNFDYLLHPPKKTSSAYNFSISKIFIENGQIDYLDKNREFFETLKEVNLEATISLDKKIPFYFSSKTLKNNSSLQLSGNYDIKNKNLISDIILQNIHAGEYLSLFSIKSVLFQKGVVHDGKIHAVWDTQGFSADGHLHLTGSQLTAGSTSITVEDILLSNIIMVFADKKLHLKASAVNAPVSIGLPNRHNIKGLLSVDIHFLNFADENLSLQSDIKIDNAVYSMNPSKNISGSISADKFFIKKTSGLIDIKSNLKADNLLLIYDRLQLKSLAAVDQFSLTLNENSLNITGGVLLDNFFMAYEKIQAAGKLQTSSFKLNKTAGAVTVETTAQYSNADITHGQINITGQPDIQATYKYDSLSELKNSYDFNIAFESASAKGLPSINLIENIVGVLRIKPDLLEFDNIYFKNNGASFNLTGRLKNFKTPHADISLIAENLNLTSASDLFKDHLKKYNLTIEGLSNINLNYKGLLSSSQNADIELTSDLKDAVLKNPKLSSDITNIHGRLSYKKDLISWSNLQFNFNNIPFTINGRLENFSRPTVITNILSAEFKADTAFNIFQKSLKIESFKGSFLNSYADLNGNVDFKENAQPELDFKGTVDIQLTDISSFLKNPSHPFHKLKLQGPVKGDVNFKGQLNDWKNWAIKLDLNSPKISLKSYELTSPIIKYAQRDGIINDSNLTAGLYLGMLNVSLTGDLKAPETPMTASAKLDKLSLGNYRKLQNIKKKEFDGNLSIIADLKGSLTDITKLTGRGSFVIDNGYLWKVIPQYDAINFTDAKGNFIIRNQQIQTEDAHMISQAIILKGSGWIDFNTNISLRITPMPIQAAAIKAGGINIDATSLIAQVASIDCTGTISHPKCTPEISPFKIFKNTKDVLQEGTGIITEGIGSILDDIIF